MPIPRFPYLRPAQGIESLPPAPVVPLPRPDLASLTLPEAMRELALLRRVHAAALRVVDFASTAARDELAAAVHAAERKLEE